MRLRGPSGSAAPQPPASGDRPPLGLIYAVTITGILANPLLTPVIPDILDAFDVAPGRAGLLVAASTLPGIVMAPLIGLLAARHGRRRVLLPCLVAFGTFGVASAFATSFGMLVGLRLAQGVGSAGLINLAVVIIGDHWDGEERTRLIGRNAAVLTASLAIIPPIGGLLGALGGWRLAFAPYGVGLVTAAILWRRLPSVVPSTPTTMGNQLREALGFVRRPEVSSSMVLGFAIFVLIFGLLLTVLPVHLEERFGLGAAERGLVLALPAATSTLGALLLGRLRARHGGHRVVAAAIASFAVAFVAIGAAPALVVLVAGALLFGFGQGLVLPSLQDTAASAAPASSRGAVVAVWVGSARAGQSAGPLLAGASLAFAGAPASYFIGAAIALVLCAWQARR